MKMANKLKDNRWILDTAGAITPDLTTIIKVLWVAPAAAGGELCTLQDADGDPIWTGVATGPNYSTGIFDLGGAPRTVKGLSLGVISGTLFLYMS
jgi:hypothetical protein